MTGKVKGGLAPGGTERETDTKTSGMGEPPTIQSITAKIGGQYGTLPLPPPRLRILHPFVEVDRDTATRALAGFNRWVERWNSVAPYAPLVPAPLGRFAPAPMCGLKLPKRTLLLVDYKRHRLLAFGLMDWKAWATGDNFYWQQASLESIVWAGSLEGGQHE